MHSSKDAKAKTYLASVPGGKQICLAAFVLALAFQVTACANAYIDLNEAQTHPGFRFQGEFTGTLRDSDGEEPVNAALQVSIHGGKARGLLYYDSLPDGIDNHDDTKIRSQLEGVYLNGVLVHNDVELPQGTGVGGTRPETPRAPLYLQSHTGPVRFQNIWLIPGSYAPPSTDHL